ncbi:hypothetical protein ACS0TY_001121 [Phlomoides rotata]
MSVIPLSPFLFLIVAEGIMNRAVEKGPFFPAAVEKKDDTIFVGEVSRDNAIFIKRFLKVIHLVSGLKVNVEKCCLHGINVENNRLEELAELLGCGYGAPQFSYLGIKVGSNHRLSSEWNGVIQRVRNRLLRWDKLNISIGGRLTLSNAVLTSLPSTNGKWRWRFYKEMDRLWVKVVESSFGLGCREGLEGGSISSGGRFLGWWGEVREMSGVGDEGWFAEGMMKVVGDGVKISFWDERWVGDVCFRRKFHRLYNLSEDKEKMVGEMGEWVGEEWRWKWAWRRDLFDREVVRLNELISILDRSHIKRGVQDTWRWDMAPDGLYTVHDVYD